MKRISHLVCAFLLAIPLTSCQPIGRPAKIDDGIIISEAVAVRNSTAVLAVELTQVRRGDEVAILERRKDWVKIRTSSGVEGWIEAREVISKQMYLQAKALEAESRAIPAQATGQVTGHVALRITPGRASDDNIIFYVPSNTLVEVLARVKTERMSTTVVPKRYDPPLRARAKETRSESSIQYDYWYQVRLPESFLVRTGWIYAPLVELKVPERLIHLQGDYSIVAWYELATVEDEEIGPSTHYVTFDRHRLRPVPGTDFDHLRLWVWDLERHRYKIGRWEITHGVFPVSHRVMGTTHLFQLKLYHPRTGELYDADYTVDVSDPTNPRLIPPKRPR
ncbi:MAG TPA: SH3 domain-containing protein [Blastocatellia bacterium]|nr:SH3 domain-containing protein [Blastocatellia bacterium]